MSGDQEHRRVRIDFHRTLVQCEQGEMPGGDTRTGSDAELNLPSETDSDEEILDEMGSQDGLADQNFREQPLAAIHENDGLRMCVVSASVHNQGTSRVTIKVDSSDMLLSAEVDGATTKRTLTDKKRKSNGTGKAESAVLLDKNGQHCAEIKDYQNGITNLGVFKSPEKAVRCHGIAVLERDPDDPALNLPTQNYQNGTLNGTANGTEPNGRSSSSTGNSGSEATSHSSSSTERDRSEGDGDSSSSSESDGRDGNIDIEIDIDGNIDIDIDGNIDIDIDIDIDGNIDIEAEANSGDSVSPNESDRDGPDGNIDTDSPTAGNNESEANSGDRLAPNENDRDGPDGNVDSDSPTPENNESEGNGDDTLTSNGSSGPEVHIERNNGSLGSDESYKPTGDRSDGSDPDRTDLSLD